MSQSCQAKADSELLPVLSLWPVSNISDCSKASCYPPQVCRPLQSAYEMLQLGLPPVACHQNSPLKCAGHMQATPGEGYCLLTNVWSREVQGGTGCLATGCYGQFVDCVGQGLREIRGGVGQSHQVNVVSELAVLRGGFNTGQRCSSVDCPNKGKMVAVLPALSPTGLNRCPDVSCTF